MGVVAVESMPIRVQTLAENNPTQVPPEYIQPPENRPQFKTPTRTEKEDDTSSSSSTVPVIDLFEFDPDHWGDVRRQMGQACKEWGAFQVTNHGVPIDLLRRMKSVGLSFFKDSPMSYKLGYAVPPASAASEGYGSRMLLTTSHNAVLDWRDYFDHHTLPISRRNPSRWPDFPPTYREVVIEYSDCMKALTQKLLAFMSESLGLPSSCIEDAVGDFYQNITVSYYPPCPQPELTLGLQSHSDIGAITLLIQDDVGGLQVFKDGEWMMVQPLSDAIVVILADQAEIITNGKYRSAQHRAIASANKARLSVATFHDPAKTKKISPAPALVTESSPPRYRQIVYGEYISSWYSNGPEGKRNIDKIIL